LRDAGPARPELEAVLAEASPERREAACFLIANLPRVDLVRSNRDVLGEHLEYAFLARQTLPWGEKIPEEDFLHFVLPPRCTQEPLEPWRRYFYDQLYPLVKDAPSIGSAALAVNRWCGERVTYKYTQPRDQGPFETLKSGYGRCEEMTIVLMCALRSVCIPAREAFTPYWPFQDDNHAWTETWIDGNWGFMGSCEPAESLCQAWFSNPAKRAALVLAPVFGVPRDTAGVYRTYQKSALLYTTPTYTGPGFLEVTVVRGSRPAPDQDVVISVFNYGALREIATKSTDRQGRMTIPIGDGTYFVSAGGAADFNWQVVSVKKGEHVRAKLDIAARRTVEGNLWLRYAPLAAAR
jgi:hypothetical protein